MVHEGLHVFQNSRKHRLHAVKIGDFLPPEAFSKKREAIFGQKRDKT